MTFDILLVNSLSASTVKSYDKRIEQRGRAGAVRGDHRSFPRTFIIMARRRRQEPRPPSPLSRETVFSMRLSEHFRVHLKLQRISAFSRKKNKTRKTKEKKKKQKKKHHGTPRDSKPSHRIRVTAYESTRSTKKKKMSATYPEA